MPWHGQFFRSFWPVVATALTAERSDTESEVRGLLRLLPLRPGARILDVPCGFGRHSVELARRGFHVTGVDISPHLLAQARQAADARGVKVEIRRLDMRRLAYRGRFDAVLNLFTSFGYYGERQDLDVLRRLRRALRPRGWLVLHMVNREWIMRNFRARERYQAGEFTLAEKRAFHFASGVLTTELTARRGRRVWRGTTRLRLYAGHELLRMALQVGFSTAELFGDLAGAPPSFDASWLAMRARR